ncbi:MAG: hypothetical protein HYW77_03365 [Parcubacteria group bacterium]|nr:hypothetical protein [Parcubacteria group bacterium]
MSYTFSVAVLDNDKTQKLKVYNIKVADIEKILEQFKNSKKPLIFETRLSVHIKKAFVERSNGQPDTIVVQTENSKTKRFKRKTMSHEGELRVSCPQAETKYISVKSINLIFRGINDAHTELGTIRIFPGVPTLAQFIIKKDAKINMDLVKTIMSQAETAIEKFIEKLK